MLYYTSMAHNALLTEVRRIILVQEYLLFVCCGISTFQDIYIIKSYMLYILHIIKGQIYIYLESYKYNIHLVFFSPISPHCVHLTRMARTMELKKKSPNSNPAEKAMALLGLLDNVCNADGIATA